MLRGAPASSQARARKAQDVVFAAPTAGWISNRNIAIPNEGPQGASLLENFFPTATGAILRRGSRTYAQLGDGSLPATTMFKYINGNNRRLFGATATTVYDITAVTQAYNYSIGLQDDWTLALTNAPDSDTIGQNSTDGLEVLEGTGGGDWSTVQFASSGGVFLIGVNGASEGFRFNGTAFQGLDTDVPITFPSGTPLTTADLSYVWSYKNRLWFIQKQSMTAWYLPVDQIGGELARFDLGSELPRGGSLQFGQNWSLSGGDQGGLSEQCVFASTEGEVAVYQGSNPADAADWRKVGLYRIGNPLGTKGLIRAGGDLVIATNIGFIPLSAAIEFDIAALGQRAISQPIEVSWFEAIQSRGESGWAAVLWPEQQMVVVAPPTFDGNDPMVFAANARTGAWSKFTNWNVTCMETFNGRLLFGGPQGFIKDAMVGGTDDDLPFTGAYIPLFTDAGSAGAIKTAKNARATTRSGAPINERIGCRFDFDTTLPTPPDVAPVPIGNEWDNAIWDQSVWDAGRTSVLNKRRYSVSGVGNRLAPTYQVTSGAAVPLDVEIVAIEVTFEIGGGFT